MASIYVREIKDSFYRQVKVQAAKEGLSVKAFVLKVLAQYLNNNCS